MKVLVTGGAGFVGSNLIKFFVNKTNYKIISIAFEIMSSLTISFNYLVYFIDYTVYYINTSNHLSLSLRSDTNARILYGARALRAAGCRARAHIHAMRPHAMPHAGVDRESNSRGKCHLSLQGGCQWRAARFCAQCVPRCTVLPQPAETRKRLERCLLYTSPSPRDATLSRKPSSE